MNNSGPGPNGPHGPTLGEKWMMIVIVIIAAVALLGWCRPVDAHDSSRVAYCQRWGDLAHDIASYWRPDHTETETLEHYSYLGDQGEQVVRLVYRHHDQHPIIVRSVVRLRCETEWENQS